MMAKGSCYFYGVNWGDRPEAQVEGPRQSAASVYEADESGRALLAEWPAFVITDRVGATLMVVAR